MGVGEVEDSRCRLLVRLDDAPDAALAEALAALADADRLAAVVATPTPAVVTLAMGLPTALLDGAGGAPDPAVNGVVVAAHDDPVDAVAATRRRWGADAILVVDVGTSRHAAMEAGEAGADAVLFSGEPATVRDCVAWWSELFVLPVAAPVWPEALAGTVAAGADFLLVDGDRLTNGEAALPAFLDRIAEGESARSTDDAAG